MGTKSIENVTCEIAKECGWWPLGLYMLSRIGFPDYMFLANGGRVKFVIFNLPLRNPGRPINAIYLRLQKLGFEVQFIENIEDALAAFPDTVVYELERNAQ